MKREIKFRGKIARDDLKELEAANVEIPHKNGWVVGSFISPNLIVGDLADIDWDFFAVEWWVKVIPETIGLFTGPKDKDGVEIYEGDIVDWVDSDGNKRRDIVKWINGGLVLCNSRYTVGSYPNIKVVGNIHDNPELIANLE